MKDGKATYASVRLAFLHALRASLCNEEPREPPELDTVLAAHPVDLDRMAETIRGEFGADAEVQGKLLETPEEDEPEEPSKKPRTEESGAATSSSSTFAAPGPHGSMVAEVAATAASSDAPAPDIPKHAFRPGGKEPLDEDGRPCSHYRRSVPPLVWTHLKGSKKMEIPRGQTYDNALHVLRGFISERPVLRNCLEAPVEKAFEWYNDFELTEPLDPVIHGNGRWFWSPCVDWVPRHALGREVGENLLRMRRLSKAVHSTSLYALVRTLSRGILPGPLAGRGDRTGIYCFKIGTETRARSSSYYSVYSLLTDDLMITPRLVLAIDESRVGEPGFGAISAGGGQWLVQPGQVYLVGVHFHVLTLEEAHGSDVLSCGYDTWDPDYELSQ